MTDIKQSDLLRSLSTMYSFPGGAVAPGEMDIASPIPVVHDVHEIARVGSSIVYVYELATITDGAGTRAFESVDAKNLITERNVIAARAKEIGLSPGTADVWLLDVGSFVTDATKGNLLFSMAALYPDLEGATETYALMLGYWNSDVEELLEAGGTYVPMYDNSSAPGRVVPGAGFRTRLPRRVNKIVATFADAGGAAASFSLRLLVAITPRGVEPPRPG